MHYNNNIKRIFIPDGLTRKLEPLDISVNKSFKVYIKQKFNQYQLQNSRNTITNNHAKVERKIIVQWEYEVWNNEIKTETILMV